MIRKLFLFIFMLIPLLGAIVTDTPIPVLAAMGALILFALLLPSRSELP
jgi:hypothetical protein